MDAMRLATSEYASFSIEPLCHGQRVSYGSHIFPIIMTRNYVSGVLTFFNDVLHRSSIVFDAGIAEITKIFIGYTFNQASPVQYFFFLKPNHNVIGCMTVSGIKCLKRILPKVKYSDFLH